MTRERILCDRRTIHTITISAWLNVVALCDLDGDLVDIVRRSFSRHFVHHLQRLLGGAHVAVDVAQRLGALLSAAAAAVESQPTVYSH